jgi:hypothetical protein
VVRAGGPVQVFAVCSESKVKVRSDVRDAAALPVATGRVSRAQYVSTPAADTVRSPGCCRTRDRRDADSGDLVADDVAGAPAEGGVAGRGAVGDLTTEAIGPGQR